MPPLGPLSRNELIAALRRFGFAGPFAGGKHQYMVKDSLKLAIPNPHRGDISRALLIRILRQINVSREEWETLE